MAIYKIIFKVFPHRDKKCNLFKCYVNNSKPSIIYIGLKLSLTGPKCFGLDQKVFDMAQKPKAKVKINFWFGPKLFGTVQSILVQNYFGPIEGDRRTKRQFKNHLLKITLVQ